MFIKIDPSDNVSLYKQVINQIKYSLATGSLRAHEQLPSVRQLAVQLLINPNTVVRAYRELEREGLTYSRRGQGIFVAEGAQKISREDRKRIVTKRIEDALDEAIRSKLDRGEIERIIRKKLKGSTRKEG